MFVRPDQYQSVVAIVVTEEPHLDVAVAFWGEGADVHIHPEKSNRGRDTIDGYGYFDSLLEIAPDSLASDEIRRFTDEMLDCIAKAYNAAVTLTS